MNTAPVTAGEAFLVRLAERGVDYLFANPGTDFPPLIEALAAARPGRRLPVALAVPHENLAVAMAHGHAMVSGRPQAVMVHVNVGLANAVMGVINAARANVPLILCSGRTPLTEAGAVGSRNRYIHWAQEMFDQTGLVREAVKWCYEPVLPQQLLAAVDRAVAVAASEPAGPVYLSLPRELLAAALDPPPLAPAVAARAAIPDPAGLDQAAELIAAAERPLLVTSGLGRRPGASTALTRLAEAAALPVVAHYPRHVSLASDHPLHLGYDPAPHVGAADLVVVVECEVPWLPSQGAPPDGAKVVHLGLDPLFERYPLRGFRADLAIAGDSTAALTGLAERLGPRLAEDAAAQARRHRVAAAHAALAAAAARRAEDPGAPGALAPAWVAAMVERLRPADSILINEMGLPLSQLRLDRAGGYFGMSPAGGLGWGLGAALGAKLAAPGRTVIAAVGDGSYMFGNPTPAHWVARAHGLPILVLVLDNGGWNAVRRAVRGMYPEGSAAAMTAPPLVGLEPRPAYEQVAAACGGHGARVERPEELEPALTRALAEVAAGRQALVSIACAME